MNILTRKHNWQNLMFLMLGTESFSGLKKNGIPYFGSLNSNAAVINV